MKVFLDMDGVLADLFNTVTQETHNKPYKSITSKEKEEATRIWTSKTESNNFFKRLGGVERFFANLPTFGDKTQAIIDATLLVAGSYRICSRPAGMDIEASKRGKLLWIKTHLSPQPVEAVFPQNKATYAINNDGSPNILVDDFPPYIKNWRDAGGIAIEIQTDSFDNAQDLLNVLQRKLKTEFDNQPFI